MPPSSHSFSQKIRRNDTVYKSGLIFVPFLTIHAFNRMTAADALVQQPVSFLSQPAHGRNFLRFWVWLHKPEMVIMVTHLTLITLKRIILILGGVCKNENG